MLDATVLTWFVNKRVRHVRQYIGCVSSCWKCQSCHTLPTDCPNDRSASATLCCMLDTSKAMQDDEAPAPVSEGLQEATTETPSSMESPSTPSEMDVAG